MSRYSHHHFSGDKKMVTIEQLHEAAKIIRADAEEGIQSATAIVGRDVALGMLVIFIRHSINGERFPDADDTTEQVNEILRRSSIIQ